MKYRLFCNGIQIGNYRTLAEMMDSASHFTTYVPRVVCVNRKFIGSVKVAIESEWKGNDLIVRRTMNGEAF